MILDTIKSYATTSVLGLIFSAICALVFILVGFKLSSWIVKLFKKGKAYERMDASVASFLASFISVGLKVLVILVAATIVGINAVALSTVLGTLGVTVGLALQGSLSNLIGGLMILFFHPFKVGDYIDNHSDAGTVREIGIFYTTLDTPDNKRITVPNGLLSNATVVNYSAEATRRVDIEFTASYKTDIDKV
ncbi:MAG: mechanosensitive ion channel, partial [Clostridiales bacterium]|nr:mechanosensitive ion channel [Clostridiales bacterium]